MHLLFLLQNPFGSKAIKFLLKEEPQMLAMVLILPA